VKVVHLIGQMVRGGAERQLLRVAEGLKARGWEQAVITFHPGDVWDARVTEMGIPLFGIPRHPIKFWRLWRLWRLAQRERAAILHSWSAHTNVYAHWVPGSARKLFSLRGNPTVDNFTGESLGRPRHLEALERADCLVSNSRLALESLRAYSDRLPHGEVVGNIVDAPGRAEPGAPVSAPRIVAAGQLIPLKAYDVLLQALAMLAAEGRQFELLLAGEGPERARLEEMRKTLGLEAQVKLLGGVEDVPGLFAGAHLLAHPSRSEGLSNTILEAMAEGLPVVAARAGGTPEIVEDGCTGLLTPPGCPETLARAMGQLLDDPALRGRIGGAALQFVREKCSPAEVTGQYERIYRSLVDRRDETL
jgi:glycosyltransferase involved in cell wall biosynthesis